ncbi:ABC transporter substrate binding protein [Bradyrhizobium sp. CB1650]|uniref:ABC transporter substrate binding protein n=1 Tax=Bradyrhizobium sp. CB1650 TaxID=3039153 RepID=UPI0024348AC5|nr:ABC transporter substrate binding protein [Bradyrhizobium sp. CB1650]WGD55259.1 ABC transporter substrate binding protein [Bradyrhizobium sp. CB1650]
MKRREFMLTAGAAALWSGPVRAQKAAPVPVVGVLGSGSSEGWAPLTAAFRRGLGEVGYVEGQNLAIEYRWAEGQYDRLPAMAADLVQRQLSAIATFTTPGGISRKENDRGDPIVFTTIGNPVQIGLVPSLSRPAGNVTGATSLNVEVGPKRLEFMHELLPAAKDFALLVNPNSPTTENQ